MDKNHSTSKKRYQNPKIKDSQAQENLKCNNSFKKDNSYPRKKKILRKGFSQEMNSANNIKKFGMKSPKTYNHFIDDDNNHRSSTFISKDNLREREEYFSSKKEKKIRAKSPLPTFIVEISDSESEKRNKTIKRDNQNSKSKMKIRKVRNLRKIIKRSNSEIKNILHRRKKNFCKELNNLISKFGFSEVLDGFYKEENEQNNNTLFSKIKEISKNISNKYILFSLLKEFSDDFNKNKYKLSCLIQKMNNKTLCNKILNKKRSRNSKSQRMNTIDNKTSSFESSSIIYKSHIYKKNSEIYCYTPKNINSNFTKRTLYCINRKKGCKAKLVIYRDQKKTDIIGTHNCIAYSNLQEIDENLPDIKNKKWRHIQLGEKDGNMIILSKY